MHVAAWKGLKNADIAPLVELLRSEFTLNEFLRMDIADAIEGLHADTKISAQRPRAGRRSDPAGDLRERNGMIALFVEGRAAPNAVEAAVAEAEARFKLSRASILKARSKHKAFIETLPDNVRKHFLRRCADALRRM